MRIDTDTSKPILLRPKNLNGLPSPIQKEKGSGTFEQGLAMEISKEPILGSSQNNPLPSTNYIIEPANGAPYSFLADKSGIVTYNGVTYQCNDAERTISLGDMSRQEDVLNIYLSGGGSLRVNRSNFGDLSKSIGMFSAKDQGIIMRALATDAKTKSVKNEIEEETSKVCNLTE